MSMNVNDIYRLIGEGMMGVAIWLMKSEMDEMPYELQSRFENVEMLVRQYYRYDDKSMDAKVRCEVLELADDIHESRAMKSAVKYEYSIRHNWHIDNDTLIAALSAGYEADNALTKELDARLIVLFRQIWLSDDLDASAMKKLKMFMTADGNMFARKMAAGAVMLRCVRHYDIRLVDILMECTFAEAYVAVVLIAMACQKRIDCDLMSLDLFRRYMADSDNREKCALVYDNVMRTFETQNIANVMRDKIFPIVREQGMQFQNRENVQLFDENGLNPEWEDKLEESGIMERMRKINDLQLDGADIHYESFQMMKSNPFFTETAHWFFPFDISYHQFGDMADAKDGLGELPKLLNLCDSDRYSLFLMLKSMGVGGLGDALKNLGIANYEEVREQLGNDEKWKETVKVSFSTEVRFAVMNHYRFYRLAPNHSDMTSPFGQLTFAWESELGSIMMSPEMRYKAASTLFKARQWDMAYGYFCMVVDDYIAEDHLIYQKMGYCREKAEQWRLAVQEYEKSDIVVPDDVWTLRHLAFCHRQLHEDDIAAAMYRMVLELDKESVEAIDNLIDIYMHDGDYVEAKPLLYEMEYRRGEMGDSSSLGYCLFMLGEMAEALKYLDKACCDGKAGTAEFAMRAVCSGSEAHIAEACAIIYNAADIVTNFHTGNAGRMMENLGNESREKIKSIINKIILEQ